MRSKLIVPKDISCSARLLMEELLNEEFKERLGVKGSNQIKNHDFFLFLNWDDVNARKTRVNINKNVVNYRCKE